MNNKIINSSQGASLSSRVRDLVDSVWGGSVNRAAKDLGISQSLLHRVASGDLVSTRTSVVDAFRRYLEVSADWLLGGPGPKPGVYDRAGRPLVAGVPRWRRVLERLELGPPVLQEVEDLPYGIWRAAGLLRGDGSAGSSEADLHALTASLEAWAILFESALEDEGIAAVQDRVQRGRALLRLGTSGEAARFVARGPRSRVAELVRLLDGSRGE